MDRKFWAGVLIGLGLAMALLFGFRLAHFLRRGSLAPHPELVAETTDVSLIREWMTIPYVARTYGVPDEFLFEALELPEKDNRKMSLLELNEVYFPAREGFVIARVQEAILAFQSQVPLPPEPPRP
ncbi:MAG: hypothetical protein A2Z03_09355 [Chloroflexi bacterium RBG_16_56_8]|nr:MAG: hypothetical protein A2Z03_09355 [Chloroflexi bacterium RBG_16_56_8]